MKRFVNGVEADLTAGEVDITTLPDRLIVRTPEGSFSAVAVRDGDRILVSFRGKTYTIEKALRTRAKGGPTTGEMRAPMPGAIVDVLVAEGDTVDLGDKILVLEAMKTQQAFTAPFAGTVSQLKVTKGQQVGDGDLLAVVTALVVAE